jgi:hypothetical protein
MAPYALRQRGLAAALQQGPLFYACLGVGIEYRFSASGGALEGLSAPMQRLLHRLAVEAAAYLSA